MSFDNRILVLWVVALLKSNFFLRILLKKHPLIAIHEGKYFKTNEGIAVGPGCFTRGLEYAAGTKAIIVGKPNPFFFKSALPPAVQPDECVMIGDVS